MKGKNIIVIMSDEHNPSFMGCSGHSFINTPHLDALAERGVRFANAYTPSPICVPARAAFATGHRVHETRHWDNAMPYVGDPSGWGHVLQQRGIRVESIGKLHYRNEEDPVGFDAEHIPMHVLGGHGMVWASIRDPYLPSTGRKRMLGDRIGMGESPYTSYDRSVTERTLDWLRGAAAKHEPFALYVGLVAPHFPLIAPQAFFDLYDVRQIPDAKLHPKNGYERHPWVQAYAEFERSEERFQDEGERVNAFLAYYGLCSFLDSNVGRIVSELNELGLTESTHVIYTSDHGDNVGARGLWGKSTLYQESVGIPMIVTGPDVRPAVCETPVDLLDLYPTILQAVGVDPAPHMGTRTGKSLFSIAAEPPDLGRVILSEYHAAGSNTAGFMIRKGPWKYHHYVRFQPELFNLDVDPEELHDLSGEPAYAAVLADMKAALYAICDPDEVDRLAKADQAALIERMGGVEVASTLGSSSATPAPTVEKAA